MAAALVPREMANWSLTAVALGALEGGLLGIIVKNHFDGVTSPALINMAVAIVAAAPSFTNLSSFVFAALAAGRDKTVLLSRLMWVMGICLFVMAVQGISAGGLVIFCLMTVVARTAWSGILTVRAAIWRANFTREWRGQVTARIVQVSSLLVASCSALIGFLLDWHENAFRVAFILAGACAVFAALVNRKAKVRRHGRLLAAERAERSEGGKGFNLSLLKSVLRDDQDFRRYMIGMMILGSGNLMLLPVLVIQLNERLHLNQLNQVMVTSSVPLLVLCFFVPYWARVLDRKHIFSFRAVQSWCYVITETLFGIAIILQRPEFLWPASIMQGVAYAGGHLGWNLGHNDFSSDGNAAKYMAIHVTLTGLRGLVMPLVAVAFYEYLAAHSPTHAAWAMLFGWTFTLSGSLMFVWLHFDHMKRHKGRTL